MEFMPDRIIRQLRPMPDYIPLLRETLERKNFPCGCENRVVEFSRSHSGGDGVEVPLKFVFMLFPAGIRAFVSITSPLQPEQAAVARRLLYVANRCGFQGKFDCETESGLLQFNGTFKPATCDKPCNGSHELSLEFMIDYTTEIVPDILSDIFIQARSGRHYLMPDAE
jgi:hypothetical protein